MRGIILTLMIFIGSLSVWCQHYTLHSASSGVTVEINGKKSAATKGMKLKATDVLNIPESGVAEVMNDVDKRIYKSIRPGKVTVTKLMIEARQQATDNIGTLASNAQFGTSRKPPKKRVYNEKGMVNRTLEVYNPECDSLNSCCDSIALDYVKLAEFVSRRIMGLETDTLPEGIKIVKHPEAGDSTAVRIENLKDIPVYVNVLEFKNKDEALVDFQSLCQLEEVFELQPTQQFSLRRDDANEKTSDKLLIISFCRLDMENLIENIKHTLAEGLAEDAVHVDYPVYVVCPGNQ